MSHDKQLRTLQVLREATDGVLVLCEWVKMTGLLNHLMCVLVMPYHAMYGVYAALDAARLQGLAQDDAVQPAPPSIKALCRWTDALRGCRHAPGQPGIRPL